MHAPSRRPSPPVTYLLFLGVLLLLAAGYTAMAFAMDWRVESGVIGPGFFPRLVGAATIVCCVVAMVLGLRGSAEGGDEVPARAEADGGDGATRDPGVTLVAVAAMVVFLVFFEVLGALLSSVLFLVLLLSVVNRGQHRTNLLVSAALPIGLHLLFEVLLDAGLPPGLILPL
ncbi:MAG: tripartite tricarboxylate transporter TctB family protein [Carbonactinosporaceae bacterium]